MSQAILSSHQETVRDNAEHYFFEAKSAFDVAADKTGRVTRYFNVGPLKLVMHFAGQALLERLTRAFKHIEAQDGQGTELLHVYCFDSASTGTKVPPPPWPATAYGPKGHIVGYNTDRVHSLYQPGLDILNLYHRDMNEAVYWVDSQDTIPYWESSFPMRGILHWWSLGKPFQLMHAAAVGLPEGGVLLAGKSGSGKSTTSLCCLYSNLQYISDDYILAGLTPPHVYSLYSTAKLVPDNLQRFPQMKEAISNKGRLEDEKALFYLAECMPHKIERNLPLKGILLPRVTGMVDTTLSAATSAEALFALAPTTVMHLEGGSREAFDKMGQLSKNLPCAWLNLGTDLNQIPRAIENYIKMGL